MRDPHYVGCVSSQLKTSEFYILSFELASIFFIANTLQLLGFNPIHKGQ